MRQIITFTLMLTLLAGGVAAETMLDYFKGRLPATTPLSSTDKMPVMQGNGSAIRMVNPADFVPQVCQPNGIYDGADGSKIYTGGGAPAGSLGVDGDFYLDTVSSDYFQKTGTPTTWMLKGNLKGNTGNTGSTITCSIVGGVRSITYDQDGLNPVPAPALFPYSVALYENGFLRTPEHWSWSTTPDQMVFGSATTATFVPSIMANYSSGRVNGAIFAQVSYQGKICKAGASVAVTKIGPKGEPGLNASVTEQAVHDAYATTASNNALIMRTLSGIVSKFEVWHPTNDTTVAFFDSNGYLYFKDSTGALQAKVADGIIELYTGAVGNEKLAVKMAAVDRSLTMYRGDGVTPSFEIYSSGKWKGAEGWPATTGKTLSKDPDGTGTWITGGGGTPGGSYRHMQYNHNGIFAGSTFARYTTGGTIYSGTVIIQ